MTPSPPPSTARLTAGRGPGLADHLERFGAVPSPEAGTLAGMLADAGLTGRGGAGFPTAVKLTAVRGRRGIVVANGAEGEPLSAKDSWLLEHAPHLVLDGLQLAAADVDAAEACLYLPAQRRSGVARAIGERGRSDRYRVRLVEVPATPRTYVAGQRTAVANAVRGRPAVPSGRPGGGRVLVSNVETLAHIALIARFGPHWFAAVGDPGGPGTMLVTLSGALPPGVVEVATGTPLSRLVPDRDGIGPAVLLGGYHGRWVPADALAGTLLRRESGLGVLHALRPGQCGMRATAEIVDYLAGQSAGQCGPCVNGLPRLAGLLAGLADGSADPGALAEVHRVAGLVDGRGACHHPDGVVRLIRSAVEVFRSGGRAA